MTRQDANRKILEILNECVERCPDWRFGQILENAKVIVDVKDIFYEESIETLERMSKCYDFLSKT